MPESPHNSRRLFKGRARRRTTTRMVRFADAFSLTLITMGGMATIFAVFVVCVFLVYVAAPLFSQAEAEGPHTLVQPGKGGKAVKDVAIAFLPMNPPYTMTPEMAADAAKSIRPDILYPYLFGQIVRHTEESGSGPQASLPPASPGPPAAM